MTHDPEAPNELAELESRIGYVFRDRALLDTALRHASYAHEEGGLESNERLEFLGDSVIGLVVADLLYRAHPDWPEGRLSRALSSLVDQASLAALGERLDIGSHLQLGRSELRSGGESKPSILSDAVEAIMGAMYLDGGLAPVRGLVERVFDSALSADAAPVARDPKTRFQEWAMAETGAFPTYRILSDSEIENDEERFRVSVVLAEEPWAEGKGRTKRAAEKEAARVALDRVEAEAAANPPGEHA